ncbi:MAG: GRRM system radical SAM/SPASM domain protein [Rhodobacteraceae bacterium]|nr:GRRM system radical SAM/SPASM domain protein [Paracoccaceae bacterium]
MLGSTQSSNKLSKLVLQPTPFCNLDCSYCYLPDRQIKASMSLEVVDSISKSLLANDAFLNNKIEVLWHGGEPLSLPPAWYKEATKLLSKRTKSQIRHIFQTNATLITQDWCNHLKNTKSMIGVSIDGPRALNDKYRVKRNGKSSFDASLSGIELLRENDIEFCVLCVVTSDSIDSIEETFNFFEGMGAKTLRFLPEDIVGNNVSSSLATSEGRRKMRGFYERYGRMILNSASEQCLPDFEIVLRRILNPSQIQALQETALVGRLLNVDYEGNIFGFSPEFSSASISDKKRFQIGSTLTNTLENILESEKYLSIAREIEDGVRKCKETCQYFDFCGGGDPAPKFFEHRRLDATETLACEMRLKAMVDGVLDIISMRE